MSSILILKITVTQKELSTSNRLLGYLIGMAHRRPSTIRVCLLLADWNGLSSTVCVCVLLDGERLECPTINQRVTFWATVATDVLVILTYYHTLATDYFQLYKQITP